MNKTFHHYARLIITSLVFLFTFLSANDYLPKTYLNKLEEVLYDARLLNTLSQKVDDQVVILDVDEKSLNVIGHWPWPRRVMAHLTNTLFDHYQVKVVGFDASFPEEEEVSADNLIKKLRQNSNFKSAEIQQILASEQLAYQGDALFAESVVARNLVLGYTFEDWIDHKQSYLKKGIIAEPIFVKQQINDLNLTFYRAGGYIGNYELLGYATSLGGYFSYPREGSTLRKIPLFYLYDDDVYPSLDLQVALIAMGSPSVELLFDPNADEKSYLTIDAVKVGEHAIPVDEKFNVYVPYKGPMKSFAYISASDILTKQASLSALKDKIVILGTSATGLLDLRSTPVGDSYPGVEVHANVIAGLLENSFKKHPAYQSGIELLMLLTFVITLGYLLPKYGAIGALLSFSGCISVLFLSALWLWSSLNHILPMASSLVLIFAMTFLHLIYDLFVESKQKKRMNNFFGQYIPAELVTELDENEEGLSLSGENREMSVLFSDVRGFTTISEKLSPTELTRFMNAFLTPITKIIHDERGTIDKYMGDAVMAFWGAPLRDPQHSQNAILAAFSMKKAMLDISKKFIARGWPEIKIGIGIASGDMRVGNMGSEFRMAYTVLGDTVNLGSRLEGLTKNYGVDIIVNDIARQNAPDFAYRELDRVKVKGKNKPVTIFEPICHQQQMSQAELDELEAYAIALEDYHNRQWSDAKRGFKQLLTVQKKTIYQIYLERIANYQAHPPAENWDGVFSHKTK